MAASTQFAKEKQPKMAHSLTTQRLILRKPMDADWPMVRDFFLSPRSAHVGGPYTLGQAWRQFAAEVGHWDLRGYGMWAVTLKDSGETIGLIGPWFPADWPETEIGWFIFDAYEGKGYAAEAAEAAIDYAWSHLKWDTIVHYIAPENMRSIALAERMGAVHDPNAPQPKPDQPCLVFRHPKPKEFAL